ncbi:MAG: PLP-dependent aminotransferase family protein [Thermomicrobiales bacterium]
MNAIQWDNLLARRAASLRPSPFVDLRPMMKAEDLIFFGGGTPPPERIPVERLKQASIDVWEDAREIAVYAEADGHLPLRELICERMARRGVDVGPERVLITNGSQQGIDLVARALFDPGDRVVVEGPTYFGALQAFDPFEVEYLVAPVDEHGIIPGQLRNLLEANDRVKAIYTVSIYQNPTGATISPERRSEILDIAREAGVAIIEDDPYGELTFQSAPPKPLVADDPNVIYLGTFSKTIMPALRIGWMVFPPAIGPSVLDGKEAVDIQSDRFVQRMIVGACQNGWLDHHIGESIEVYRRKRDAMISALECEMPDGVRWNCPEGGFFLWLELPDGTTARALLGAATDHHIGFLPGYFFYPDRRPVEAIRLGFTTLPDERIVEGIGRLGRAIGQASGKSI